MSEAAKTARDAMKAKAKRLTSADPREKVDSSTWTPPEAENAGVQTGARPLVKRLYKKGGKVVGKAEGHKSEHRADRKPRKSGGKATHKAPWVDDLINRDVRMANDVREGEKHVGGFKKGGKAHKLGGGTIGGNPVSMQNQAIERAAGVKMKKGGRAHKADGGADLSYLPIEMKEAPKPFKRTGIEEGYRPSTYGEENLNYRDEDKQKVANIAKYGSMKGNPTASSDYPERKHGGKADGHKVGWLHHAKGGKVSHMEWEHSKEDLREDKKLAKKHHMSMEEWEHSKLDEKHDRQQSTKGLKHGGEAMHHEDCSCKMCNGGRMGKYSGGGIFSGNSTTKIPGEVKGGRTAHAKGGKAGKTNVNIIIGTGKGPQAPMGMMGGAPMPNAPVSPRIPQQQPGMPPQGMPPMPQQGGMPMPPQGPMPRKSGGRAYPIDTGAGGANARLEKIDAYGLKPAKMK